MRTEASGIDMSGTPIVNLPNPVNPTDAVNLQSAQALISGGFTFHQSSPSAVWTITHNLNKLYPNIVVVDSANDLIIGYRINPASVNQMILTFSAAFSGAATLT